MPGAVGFYDVQLAFAHSTQTVFYIMAGIMVATFIVAIRGLPRGRAEHADDRDAAASHPGTRAPELEPAGDR